MDVNTEFILKGRGSNISCDFSEPIFIPTETHDARHTKKSLIKHGTVSRLTVFYSISSLHARANHIISLNAVASATAGCTLKNLL